MKFAWQSDSNGGTPKGIEVPGSAAAGIVHDLNNELTLVLNHLSMSSVAPSDLAAARAAAARCGVLTSSLLSYWRGQAAPAQQGTVDAAALVRELAASLRLPKTLHLWLDDCASAPAINADPVALRRVLLNLILNACQAMQNKGVVAVGIFRARIVIVDSGPGIAPADLPRIFEPFFTTKGSRGTGLGLSIVSQLMAQQGGTVAVESEPGCTVFELRFKE
ncbi:MAG: two-component system, cell cycle sensor histidine kinase and response regulator CckA [Bryobacterales bacterium]|nr:two-component system, cell cycle sensor histidine kinase and response regulator CckA [Bryobacterales bacterium]